MKIDLADFLSEHSKTGPRPSLLLQREWW